MQNGASLTCLNGHRLTASWAVPVERPQPGEGIPPARAIRAACPLCGNALAIFVDARTDLRSMRVRTA
jgi:hypothetical protein